MMLFLLFSSVASAGSHPDWVGIVARAETVPPCQGLDSLSEEIFRKIKVPEGCTQTQIFRTDVADYEAFVRSECHELSNEIYNRMRQAKTCREIALSDAQYGELSLRISKESVKSDPITARIFSPFEKPICKASFEQLKDFSVDLHSLASHHYGILRYSVDSPCDDPGFREYMDYVEKGES